MSGSNRKCPITDDGKTRATDTQWWWWGSWSQTVTRSVTVWWSSPERQSMPVYADICNQWPLGQGYLEVDPQLSAAWHRHEAMKCSSSSS